MICKDSLNGEILVELFLAEGEGFVEVLIYDYKTNQLVLVDERKYIDTNELYYYIYKYLKIDLSNRSSFIIEASSVHG